MAKEATNRRPALDGVRAVAVLGVIFYHFGYGWAKGGFLGVDVFFVLSGYLITSILINGMEGGGIRLGAFWARRARRLLPAVLVLCLVVALAVHFLRSEAEWGALRLDLFWTIFYGMNWHLIATDQNYFAQYLGVSPLRHAWSLAIEEQFYVIWPLLLVLLAALRLKRRMLVAVVAAGAIVSVVSLATLFDPSNPSRAYYDTFGRAHELLVGALLAFALMWRSSVKADRGWKADAVAGGALVTIGVAFALTADSWSGYYFGGSLGFSLVVAGLLWAIETHPLGWSGKALSLKPVAWLGQISYGLYLWHWPVILFAPSILVVIFGVIPTWSASPLFNVGELGLIVGVATISFYGMEQRIIKGKIGRWRLSNRWVATLAPAALVITTIGSFGLTALSPTAEAAFEPGLYTCTGLQVSPASAPICLRHQASGPQRPTFAVVGDSTANSLDGAFMTMAQTYDWTYIGATQDGCSALDRNAFGIGADSHCVYDNPLIRQQLLTNYKPDLFIYLERFLLADAIGPNGEHLVAGTQAHLANTKADLEKVAAELTSHGAMLAFIQNPPFGLPIDCTTASVRQDCLVRASDDALSIEYDALVMSVVAEHHLTMKMVPWTDLVCPGDHCVPTLEGVLVRYDRVHYTRGAAVMLAPELYQRLEQAGVAPIVVTQTRIH